MSAAGFLLLYPAWGQRPSGWLRLADGRVLDRGTAFDAIPPQGETRAAERVVLVAPGEAVALHWIELPDLAPEQARAAARLLAADVAAEPLERLHVAVGAAEDAAGAGAMRARPMAMVASAALAGWLAQAQENALDPDHVVPEPLLIPPPADDAGERHWLRDDGLIVARGAASAHVAEPALAALVADGGAQPIGDDAFEDGLATALAAMPLDLRQGAFARRRRWRLDWALARRLAMLGGLILAVTLLVQIALIARYRIDAAREDRRAARVAGAALPRDTRLADAPAQLRDRLTALRGGGLGFSASAGLLFTAVRDTGGIQLGALAFAPDGTLTATVTAPGAPEIAALTQRLGTAGLVVSAGEQRPGGGRQVVELVMRAP